MLDAAKKNELNELLTSTFNSILRIEERAIDNRLTEGLSISELHTIEAIGLHEENPMSTVAARLEVTLATLNASVGKLVQKGYAQRRRCEGDRRRVLVALTAKGRKAYRAHQLFHKHMIEEALSGLNSEEERVFATALAKVKHYFDAQDFEQGVKRVTLERR